MSAPARPSGRLRPLTALRPFAGGPAAGVRLLCFPWAGAGASVYRRIAGLLPSAIEVLAVQYPGREDRWGQGQVSRMEAIVAEVVGDLLRLPARKLVLFGHSMGAFVAFEVARALEAQGRPAPALLVVSGSGAPGRPETFVRCPAGASDDAFVADLRALGGTPAGVLSSPEMLQVLLPVLRADYQVLDQYAGRLASPVSCPLVACASDADGSVSRETVRAWAGHTTGPYEEHWFEGDHFYLNARPYDLATRLGRWALAPLGDGGVGWGRRVDRPGATTRSDEANEGAADGGP